MTNPRALASLLAHGCVVTVALALGCSSGASVENAPSQPSRVTTARQGDALSDAVEVGSRLVATTNVKLRSAPSTSAKVLGVIPSGSEVVVVSPAVKDGFYNVEYEGKQGWSAATYYDAVSGATPDTSSIVGPTAEELLALTQECDQVSDGKMSLDKGTAATVPICRLPGAVFFKADMDIDCNGVKYSGSPCNAEAAGADSETSAKTSKKGNLDAATLPFVVMPGSNGPFSYLQNGIKVSTYSSDNMGSSVAAVIYKGKVVYGILGDVSASTKVGEVSYAMAKQFPGVNADPNVGGVDAADITYVIFTGPTGRVKKNENHAEATAVGKARAAALVAAVNGTSEPPTSEPPTSEPPTSEPPTSEPPAAGCGAVTSEGECNGEQLSYCQGGNQLVTRDCASLSMVCGFDAANQYYDCLSDSSGAGGSGAGGSGAGGSGGSTSAPAGCGGVTVEGECNGDTLRWCNEGQVVVEECGAQGLGCGFDSNAGYWVCAAQSQPPAATGCGSVSYEGECDGDSVRWCENGVLKTQACGEAGKSCSYDQGNQYYGCL